MVRADFCVWSLSSRIFTVLSCRVTRQLAVPPEEPDAEHAGGEKAPDKVDGAFAHDS